MAENEYDKDDIIKSFVRGCILHAAEVAVEIVDAIQTLEKAQSCDAVDERNAFSRNMVSFIFTVGMPCRNDILTSHINTDSCKDIGRALLRIGYTKGSYVPCKYIGNCI
jgi:hypothetical protein